MKPKNALEGYQPLDTSFTNTLNPQLLFARIENVNNPDCFSTTSFTLFVKPKPSLILSDSYPICEGNTTTVTAPSGFSSYNWSNGDTTSITTFTNAATYSLTVAKDYGDITCSTIKDVEVSPT